MTAWAHLPNLWGHLPNAKYIDWVIKSLEEHPSIWNKLGNVLPMSEMDAAFDTIDNKLWMPYDKAYGSAYEVINLLTIIKNPVAFGLACNAVLALMVYDCAYMIKSDVEEIKMLAKLGDTKAILLLPACIVYNETKGLV
jgi:hypothetical protein